MLVSKSGYDPYLSSLAVKKSKLTELGPCLARLVPIIQQAQVDYIKNPVPRPTRSWSTSSPR